jgi:hypothetical protein
MLLQHVYHLNRNAGEDRGLHESGTAPGVPNTTGSDQPSNVRRITQRHLAI